MEIPSPIPNLEVKHFIADNTAPFGSGNVGRCQLESLFKAKSNSTISVALDLAFFLARFLQLIFFTI